jgi:Glycosyl hydrolase family 12/RTX calcium-binding nonapeptide repeat (4 copies)
MTSAEDAMRQTLTADFEEVTIGRVKLSNNTWGVDTWGYDEWVIGTDYRQTISYDPANLLRDVRMAWDYTGNTSGYILAYPEVIIGYEPWDEAGSKFMVDRVSDLRELTVTTDIDIGGDTNGFNVAYDLWLTDTPGGNASTITAEVMIWLHAGGFTPAPGPTVRFVGANVSASVYFEPNMDAGTDQTWSYIAIVIDGGQLTGEVDIAEMLRFLDRRGFIDGSDYLSAVELGPELQRGAGFMNLNALDYTHSKYAITAGADSLVGTDQGDMIDAEGGNDTLHGGRGSDRLIGGDGSDVLLGGMGNDGLRGGAGADRLHGGAGNDRMTGGPGADRFIWAAISTGDVIADFTRAQGDRINLLALDANAQLAGDQAFAFIGSAAFTGTRGQLRAVISAGETRILADINGDRRADLIITLDDAVTLRATDFLL